MNSSLAFSALLLLSGQAGAHDALPTATQPFGWSYDYSCCSALDCSQVRDGSISIIKEGYRVASTGEVIPWADTRIKRSKDEFYHRCTPGGNVSAVHSLCLYVPQGTF